MPVRYMYVLDGEYGAKVIRYYTKTVTLTLEQIPSHAHPIYENSGTSGSTWRLAAARTSGSTWRLAAAQGGGTNKSMRTENSGGSKAHNNLQPYVTVYMYRRTA